LQIIPRIEELIAQYIGNNLPVFLTRHLNTEDDAFIMARWWNDLISEDDPLSDLVSELKHPQAKIVRKSQYDAFHKTPLERILRDLEVEQVVITGVMTHLCCETTARTAFTRGFEVFFALDGTATCDESHHNATLLNLSHGFADLVNCNDIVERLKVLKNDDK